MYLFQIFSRRPLAGIRRFGMSWEKPLLWKVNLDILLAADTISCLIPKFLTDRKTERRRPNLQLHCFPLVSDFGAMRFRFRQTVYGRYLYFSQFSFESRRVPQAILPCNPPSFSATTGLNWANSSFAVINNSQGSIFLQKKPKMMHVLHVARIQLKPDSWWPSSIPNHNSSIALIYWSTVTLQGRAWNEWGTCSKNCETLFKLCPDISVNLWFWSSQALKFVGSIYLELFKFLGLKLSETVFMCQ